MRPPEPFVERTVCRSFGSCCFSRPLSMVPALPGKVSLLIGNQAYFVPVFRGHTGSVKKSRHKPPRPALHPVNPGPRSQERPAVRGTALPQGPMCRETARKKNLKCGIPYLNKNRTYLFFSLRDAWLAICVWNRGLMNTGLSGRWDRAAQKNREQCKSIK